VPPRCQSAGKRTLTMAIAELLELREFINSIPVIDVASFAPSCAYARITLTT
jgi:hypothetical protein